MAYENKSLDGAGLAIVNDVFNTRLNKKADIKNLGTLALKSIVEKTDLDSGLIESINRADTALQSYSESDPTVPAWAKAPTKPSYTATEVGAIPSSLADSFAKKSDITGVYIYKGSVATISDLPTSSENLIPGDVYNVEVDDMNYAWTGEKWDPLGSKFQLEYLTEAEIKSILGVS